MSVFEVGARNGIHKYKSCILCQLTVYSCEVSSFMAPTLVASGTAVVAIGYDLAPTGECIKMRHGLQIQIWNGLKGM